MEVLARPGGGTLLQLHPTKALHNTSTTLSGSIAVMRQSKVGSATTCGRQKERRSDVSVFVRYRCFYHGATYNLGRYCPVSTQITYLEVGTLIITYLTYLGRYSLLRSGRTHFVTSPRFCPPQTPPIRAESKMLQYLKPFPCCARRCRWMYRAPFTQ